MQPSHSLCFSNLAASPLVFLGQLNLSRHTACCATWTLMLAPKHFWCFTDSRLQWTLKLGEIIGTVIGL